MYYFGRGVELDYAIGDVWCRQAAAQGHERAQAHLDMITAPPPPGPFDPPAPPAPAVGGDLFDRVRRNRIRLERGAAEVDTILARVLPRAHQLDVLFEVLHHFEDSGLSASSAVACPHRLRAGGLETSTGSDAKTPREETALGACRPPSSPPPRAGPAQAASNQPPGSSVEINKTPQFHWVAATIWPHHRCTQIGEEPSLIASTTPPGGSTTPPAAVPTWIGIRPPGDKVCFKPSRT